MAQTMEMLSKVDDMIGMQKCVFTGLKDVVEFLQTQASPLRDAYLNMENCLTVSIKVQVGPSKEPGQYQVKSGVSFITDQVKFQNKRNLNPDQLELGLV